MSVTEQLLKVYRVDQQINGLRSSLTAAERFLNEQESQLKALADQQGSISIQLKQMLVAAADAEGEMKRLDERIAHLRDRMNSAKTSKEHQAILAELNSLKEKRGEHETRALEMIEKSEAIRTKTSGIDASAAERERVRGLAATERSQREAEIRDRLAELEAQRRTLAAAVPQTALEIYVALVARLEDEAMAPIEVQDRKRHEYTCGSCMMSLPVETMSSLLGSGSLTTCVSCGCILFLDEAAKSLMLSATKR